MFENGMLGIKATPPAVPIKYFSYQGRRQGKFVQKKEIYFVTLLFSNLISISPRTVF
jgi:hypothetical protein